MLPHLRKPGQELKQGWSLGAGADAKAVEGWMLLTGLLSMAFQLVLL